MADGTRRVTPHTEEWELAKSSLANIFLSPDPNHPEFGPGAHERTLLYPLELELDAFTWSSLTSYAGTVFISAVDQWEKFGFDRGEEHWVTNSDAPPYSVIQQLGWNHLQESVIYDSFGTIALTISRERHAILAGGDGAVDAVCRGNSKCMADSLPQGFLEQWLYYRDHYGTDLTIVRRMLESTFGRVRAHALMSQFEH